MDQFRHIICAVQLTVGGTVADISGREAIIDTPLWCRMARAPVTAGTLRRIFNC